MNWLKKLFPAWMRLTKRQMDLLWMDREELAALRASLGKPDAASQDHHYAEAIRLYRQSLQQAPDCDLYLMSIGACYANMGKPARGLPYLKRAAKISPGNARIQHNLASVRQMLRK
jgi:tetratricopeptide (TPR) repeat protein